MHRTTSDDRSGLDEDIETVGVEGLRLLNKEEYGVWSWRGDLQRLVEEGQIILSSVHFSD